MEPVELVASRADWRMFRVDMGRPHGNNAVSLYNTPYYRCFLVPESAG